MKSPVRFQSGPPTTIKMSQSTIVVGLMLAAFVLWLAANNRLLTYWNILTGRGGSASTSTAPATATPGSGLDPNTLANPGSDPTAPMVIPPGGGGGGLDPNALVNPGSGTGGL
jgi:hypothetical protein